MEYIHPCEESCFDFKSPGSHIQGPIVNEERAELQKRENGAGCREIGVFPSLILLAGLFLGVRTGDS